MHDFHEFEMVSQEVGMEPNNLSILLWMLET